MISKSGAQINQSIVDGITVLQALAVSEEPIGSRELARQLSLEATRVNRLLRTLAAMGMAHQTTNRKYVTGPGMHVLATQSVYASGLLRHAIAPLEQLSYLGRTVALGVLWHDSVSFLYHAKPGMTAAAAIGRIGLRPATTSGIGLALLAAASAESVEASYRDRDIPGFPGGFNDLVAALEETRQRGYARVQVHPEEAELPDKPKHTIAITVGNPVNCAIAVSGWVPDSVLEEIVSALQQAQKAIEAAL